MNYVILTLYKSYRYTTEVETYIICVYILDENVLYCFKTNLFFISDTRCKKKANCNLHITKNHSKRINNFPMLQSILFM